MLMLEKKQVSQFIFVLEIGLSLSYICIKAEKQLPNEEEFDQPVLFSSIRFPERKIKL